MRRMVYLATLGVLVGLVSAGSGAASTFAQTPTLPGMGPGPFGPAKPSRLFDGIITQAGKRWVFWITTSKRGWFSGESGNAALGYPRGQRCSTDGRAYRWEPLARAWDHFSTSLLRPSSNRRVGTFRYHRFFRHPQDRRITTQEDLTGSFSEAGTALTMRYRWVTTTPRRRCDTGWVTARAAVLRYTGTTPDGVAVGFEVKDRTGGNLEGTISGVVPACTTADAVFPAVQKRWTGVSGVVDYRGSVQLSTDGPGLENPSPHPAGFFQASGLPPESDRYYPWATGPARITGTLELSWVGTTESCPSTTTRVVLRRTHPELALTLPRPGTRATHAAH